MADQKNIALLNLIQPVIFTDGAAIYKKWMDDYVVHDQGLFILAPSGAGKTHFVNHQTDKHWIDGDQLWIAAGAHPKREWWTEGIEIIEEIDKRSDIVTMYAKKLGLWIMGASQNWLLPDAIVLPSWDQHQEMIMHREQHNYDGGATSKNFNQVLNHRAYMEKLAGEHNLPVFQTVVEAVTHLTVTR